MCFLQGFLLALHLGITCGVAQEIISGTGDQTCKPSTLLSVLSLGHHPGFVNRREEKPACHRVAIPLSHYLPSIQQCKWTFLMGLRSDLINLPMSRIIQQLDFILQKLMFP